MEVRKEFERRVNQRFLNQCFSKEEEPTIQGLIEYLSDKGIIQAHIIKRFLVLDLYPCELQKAKSKHEACMNIAVKVGLSNTQVKNILCNHINQFK